MIRRRAFVAPLSERLALAVERAEFAARGLLPFNLLFCRAHRSTSTSR
jgi:hypothetical protein